MKLLVKLCCLSACHFFFIWLKYYGFVFHQVAEDIKNGVVSSWKEEDLYVFNKL